MGRKSNKQKEAERAFQAAKNAQPLDTPGSRADSKEADRLTREGIREGLALTLAEQNRETSHSLAVERGAMVMRLTIVELVERRGLPELALEIATMKVKL